MMEKQKPTYEDVLDIAKQAFPNGVNKDYDPEAVKDAFEQLEKLGTERFDAVSKVLRQPIVTGLLTESGEPALKYFEHATQFEDHDIQERAIRILPQFGIAAAKILSSVLKNGPDEVIRTAAAYSLLEIGDEGLNIIKNMLNSEDDLGRLASTNALAARVSHAHFDKSLDNRYVPMLELLFKHLSDKNPGVRARTLRGLIDTGRFSIENIRVAINDEDKEVREIALRGLFRIGIEKSNAHMLTKLIEDPSAKISNDAIEGLSHFFYKEGIDHAAVANAIIDVLIIRDPELPSEHFNAERVLGALRKTFEANPQLPGRILHRLRDLAFENEGGIRRRCVTIARILSKDEFLILVHERVETDPDTTASILQMLGEGTGIGAIVDQISETDPRDIQKIAATQINLINEYNKEVLAQANKSFTWAIRISIISLIYLLVVIAHLVLSQSGDITSIIETISTVVPQFIAGTLLYLYRQSQKQLAVFHKQLSQTQKFLLANSVCESLEGETKQKARAELVNLIATLDIDEGELPTTDLPHHQ